MSPLAIPASAVAVELAELRVEGTLLFLDAAGHVVHACSYRLPPLFHPHAASLEAALAALRQDALGRLARLPTGEPASEVNCQEETAHG